MKYFTIIISTLFLAASIQNYEPRKSTAEVDQIQGVYVFIHSKPVQEYEYLGTFNPSVVPSKHARSIINYMIKKGKEKFPTADAVIFKDDELGSVDLVKFK